MEYEGLTPLDEGGAYIELAYPGGCIDLHCYSVESIEITPGVEVAMRMVGRGSDTSALIEFVGGGLLGIEADPSGGPWTEPGAILSLDVGTRVGAQVFSIHLEALSVHLTANRVRLSLEA